MAATTILTNLSKPLSVLDLKKNTDKGCVDYTNASPLVRAVVAQPGTYFTCRSGRGRPPPGPLTDIYFLLLTRTTVLGRKRAVFKSRNKYTSRLNFVIKWACKTTCWRDRRTGSDTLERSYWCEIETGVQGGPLLLLIYRRDNNNNVGHKYCEHMWLNCGLRFKQMLCEDYLLRSI